MEAKLNRKEAEQHQSGNIVISPMPGPKVFWETMSCGSGVAHISVALTNRRPSWEIGGVEWTPFNFILLKPKGGAPTLPHAQRAERRTKM